MSRTDGTGRRRAREASLQMLYQWEVGRSSADESVATYWPEHDADHELADPLREFANGLVRGTIARVKEIDAILTAHAQNWRVERMAVIDRLVLRLAIYELLAEAETPARVDHQRSPRARADVLGRRGRRVRERHPRRGAEGIKTGMTEEIRESDLLRQRRANFEELAQLGVDPYPRKFERSDTIGDLVAAHGGQDP